MVQLSAILKDHILSGVYQVSDASCVDRVEQLVRAKGLAPFRIDARDVTGKEQFLKRAAQALQFPDYFGGNWDALADCLTDMSWHEANGFAVLVGAVDAFALNAPDDVQTALSIFMEAAEFWRDEGKSFLVLVLGTGGEELGLTEVECEKFPS